MENKISAPLYLARLSAVLIRANNPGRPGTHPKYFEGTVLRWGVEFEKLLRTGHDLETIESAILYAQFSPYWRSRTLCAYRFRRSFKEILNEMKMLKEVR